MTAAMNQQNATASMPPVPPRPPVPSSGQRGDASAVGVARPEPPSSSFDAGRPAAMAISDLRDVVLYLALVLLPVDGTVFGVYAPFWTPISPWLFMIYALLHPIQLARLVRRYTALSLVVPLVLVSTSIPGWYAFGIHPKPLVWSLAAVAGAWACFASLHIALSRKRLDWRPMVVTLLIVYALSFVVGVGQWLSIVLDVQSVRAWFASLMARSYIPVKSQWGGGRPQFTFAEPSYIGMHLFGVLLPVYWLIRRQSIFGLRPRSRDRMLARLVAMLIVVYAAGAIVMGAGVRIIVDSLIAVAVVVTVSADFSAVRGRLVAAAEYLGIVVLTGVVMVGNSRLSSLAELGLLRGDGSMAMRIWQTLGPLAGGLRDPLHLLFGFGSGNIADAAKAGAADASALVGRLGGDAAAPKAWYASVNHDNVFTMSAYTSFIAEFSLLGFGVLLAAVIWMLARAVRAMGTRGNAVQSRWLMCWFLLVAYLYVQFEGYAFYALPLLLWALGRCADAAQPAKLV